MRREDVSTSVPDWKRFELAVARFVQALGHGARVTHDIRLPDVHTGHPRQRDVWVEWSVAGHFPAKALISCKYWSAPLDQKDIDHFNGEFISSGAQIGIIYSKAGFNERALQKAKILGFHCCKLYESEPADLPEALTFGLAYHFRHRFRFVVRGPAESYGLKQWKDVFSLPSGSTTVLTELAQAMDKSQKDKDHRRRWERAKGGEVHVARGQRPGTIPLEVEWHLQYRAFQAKLEYTMLDGSYNISAGHFIGTQATPWLDLQSADPGPGWTPIADLPAEFPQRSIVSYAIADPVSVLTDYGQQAFP